MDKFTPKMICYCFEYSEEDFLEAIRNGNEERLVLEIKSKMKDPGCFCETANPSGKCCNADIANFIKEHKK